MAPPVDGSAPAAAPPRESRSTVSAASEDDSLPGYVRVLLLGPHGKGVLMEQLGDSSFDLPYFVYPNRYREEQVCGDVRRALSPVSTGAFFTINCDLLGAFSSTGRGLPCTGEYYGIANLLLVECHGHDVQPSGLYSWKDAAWVAGRRAAGIEDWEQQHAMEVVSKLLSADAAAVAAFLVDPRYRLGWFATAASWLAAHVSFTGATVDGRVVQVQVSPASTILKIDSTAGVFFLKAAMVGSGEVRLTRTVASHFPAHTHAVEATDPVLNCFVARAFSQLPDGSDYASYGLLLGRLHVASAPHVGALRAGGAPDRSPAKLAGELLRWVDDDLLRGWFGHPLRYARLGRYVPHLVDLCHLLADGPIPLALVHGDVSHRNMAVAAGVRPILFDWEFGCVGHPFYDWHELHKELPDGARETYLDLFAADDGPAGGVRSLYDVGRTLGWCAKMWHVLDCARVCDVACRSPHMEDFLAYWERALSSLMELEYPGVPKDEGPRWSFPW